MHLIFLHHYVNPGGASFEQESIRQLHINKKSEKKVREQNLA
jgi:hypothetical protein